MGSCNGHVYFASAPAAVRPTVCCRGRPKRRTSSFTASSPVPLLSRQPLLSSTPPPILCWPSHASASPIQQPASGVSRECRSCRCAAFPPPPIDETWLALRTTSSLEIGSDVTEKPTLNPNSPPRIFLNPRSLPQHSFDFKSTTTHLHRPPEPSHRPHLLVWLLNCFLQSTLKK